MEEKISTKQEELQPPLCWLLYVMLKDGDGAYSQTVNLNKIHALTAQRTEHIYAHFSNQSRPFKNETVFQLRVITNSTGQTFVARFSFVIFFLLRWLGFPI